MNTSSPTKPFVIPDQSKLGVVADDSSLTQPIEKYLTTDEAAHLLGVTPAQLRNMCSYQAVPYYKLGRSNRFKKSELITLVERTRIGAKND
jgi:excisionase family DNA binding protein